MRGQTLDNSTYYLSATTCVGHGWRCMHTPYWVPSTLYIMHMMNFTMLPRSSLCNVEKLRWEINSQAWDSILWWPALVTAERIPRGGDRPSNKTLWQPQACERHCNPFYIKGLLHTYDTKYWAQINVLVTGQLQIKPKVKREGKCPASRPVYITAIVGGHRPLDIIHNMCGFSQFTLRGRQRTTRGQQWMQYSE